MGQMIEFIEFSGHIAAVIESLSTAPTCVWAMEPGVSDLLSQDSMGNVLEEFVIFMVGEQKEKIDLLQDHSGWKLLTVLAEPATMDCDGLGQSGAAQLE